MEVRRLRGRWLALVGVGAVIALLVAGFAVALGTTARVGGGGDELAVAVPGRAESPNMAPAPKMAPEMSMSAPGGAVTDEGSAGSAGSDARSSTADAPSQGVPVGGVQRALVRTAQLTVEVEDPAGAMRQVRTAAAAAGGFVTDEQTGDTGSWATLRVPADGLDRLLEEIAAYGRVAGRSTQVYDATEETIDLDARVATQQASVARVRSLLAEAESIGDVVAIESELARREAELDSLTRRLESLRDQVAMSTLTVEMRAVGAPPPPAGPTPGFLDGLATGWAGLQLLGSGMGAVVGFVLPFLPVLALLAGIGWLVRRIVRGRRRPMPTVAPTQGADGKP